MKIICDARLQAEKKFDDLMAEVDLEDPKPATAARRRENKKPKKQVKKRRNDGWNPKMTVPSTKKMTPGDRWVTVHNSRITWLLTLIVRFNRYSDDDDKDAELSKEIFVPANAISHAIEYAGCTIKAIQEISGAHIDIQRKRAKGRIIEAFS